MGTLYSYSPATGEEVGSVDTVSPEDVPDIIARSRAAQEKWAAVPKSEKIALFKKLRKMIADRVEEYAHIVFDETGKPKTECINTEVFVSAGFAAYCVKWLKKFRPNRKIRMEPMHSMMRMLGRGSCLHYEPAGVVAIISPYNFPLSIPFTEVAAAVAAGNSVILKPSPLTPMCGEAIESMFMEAGFPDYVVTCVHGDGVGEMLTSSKGIDRINFTGSTNTGKRIMESASKNLVPVTLELGGCDTMIVMNDADIDRAVKAAVWGAFANAGQICVGVQRILVQSGVYERFRNLFVRRVMTLKIGSDWYDPDISMGPVISEAAMNGVLDAIKRASERGGRILCGGHRIEREGYFIEPTVIEGIPLNSDIYTEEVFGPYTTLTPFDTLDEAIKITNHCEYALGGSLWTSDVRMGKEKIAEMDSGILCVNNLIYTFGLASTPWGGRKGSGFGKSHGEEAFSFYMNEKHIHYDKGASMGVLKINNDPWWMPYNQKSTDLQAEMTKGLFGSKKRILSVLIHALPVFRKKY